MKAIIREGKLEDAEAMAALDKRCFSLPWSKQSFSNELSNPARQYIVAVLDDKIIGYAGQWKVINEGHITNVAVDPSYRRKGLGESLLLELIRISEENGIKSHTLEVRVSNASAISLYNKLGFKIGGIRKEYYEDNLEDALILWRKSE